MNTARSICLLWLAGTATLTAAQVRVQTGSTDIQVGANGVSVRTGDGSSVRTGSEGSKVKSGAQVKDITTIATEGSTASVSVGGIGEGVEMQGVAVINGRVYVDGKEVPPNVTRYKSPRTGELYVIQRGKDGVSVTSEGQRK